MAEFESLIRLFATILGTLVLAAPILILFRQARRPKGRASGEVAGSRTWLGLLISTIGLTVLGILLWKPVSIHIPEQVLSFATILGAGLYFSGISLYLWGLMTLGSQFGASSLLGAELYQEHVLITNGPFAIIRHPLYAGVILTAFGALLLFRTWAMVVFTPISFVVLARAEREEKLLAQEFGEAWKRYATKVPKWFPKL